jgi:F5/8 type C domain-containing protein
MKTFRSILVLALPLALPLALANYTHAAGVTGKWNSEFESPVGHLKYIYDLKAEGDRLIGKAIRELNGEKSETELKEGKLTGDQVAFVEVLRRDDQEIRIEYSGKLKDNEIKFTRKVGDFATMDIVAKRDSESASDPAAGKSGKKITLKVIKVDSEETSGEHGEGSNAVDGSATTIWHTQWESDSPPPPHEIIIELIPPSRIKGFTYLPRQDEETHGDIKDYEFYAGDDPKEFGAPVKKGSFGEGKDKKSVSIDAKTCRYIKLRALSEIAGEVWTSAAEIGVIAD